MKNKSTILIMALAVMTAFTGCKKNEIDIENELKNISEETFQSLEYCSHVNVNGYNMDVIQFHFNHADNTVEKKTFSFGDGVPSAFESKTYSFAWDEFTDSKLGRKARLVAGDDVLNVLYLNNVFTLSDTVKLTEMAALADIASSVSANIANSDWAAYDPVYVMQDRWTMDTTWYETHRQGRRLSWTPSPDASNMRSKSPLASLPRRLRISASMMMLRIERPWLGPKESR